MNDSGLKTGALIVEDNTEILGVNDRIQLELLTKVLRMRINTEHMKNGVTIEDIDSENIEVIYEEEKGERDNQLPRRMARISYEMRLLRRRTGMARLHRN